MRGSALLLEKDSILHPTDKQPMATLLAIQMRLGRDEYGAHFIDACQNGRIVG